MLLPSGVTKKHPISCAIYCMFACSACRGTPHTARKTGTVLKLSFSRTMMRRPRMTQICKFVEYTSKFFTGRQMIGVCHYCCAFGTRLFLLGVCSSTSTPPARPQTQNERSDVGLASAGGRPRGRVSSAGRRLLPGAARSPGRRGARQPSFSPAQTTTTATRNVWRRRRHRQRW